MSERYMYHHSHQLPNSTSQHNDSLGSLFDDCLVEEVVFSSDPAVEATTNEDAESSSNLGHLISSVGPTPQEEIDLLGPPHDNYNGVCVDIDAFKIEEEDNMCSGDMGPVDVLDWPDWTEPVYFRTDKGYLAVPRLAALQALTAADSQLNEPITAHLIPDVEEDQLTDLRSTDMGMTGPTFGINTDTNWTSRIMPTITGISQHPVADDANVRLLRRSSTDCVTSSGLEGQDLTANGSVNANDISDLLLDAAAAAGLDNYQSGSAVPSDLVDLDYANLFQMSFIKPPFRNDDFSKMSQIRREVSPIKKRGWPRGFAKHFPFGRLHPPQKPLTGYNIFKKERYAQLKRVKGRITMKNFVHIINVEWKALSTEEKQHYYDAAEKERDRYLLEMHAFQNRYNAIKQNLLAEQRRAGIEVNNTVLQHQLEYIGPNLQCDLCEMFFTQVQSKMEHIKSAGHRNKIRKLHLKLAQEVRKQLNAVTSKPLPPLKPSSADEQHNRIVDNFLARYPLMRRKTNDDMVDRVKETVAEIPSSTSQIAKNDCSVRIVPHESQTFDVIDLDSLVDRISQAEKVRDTEISILEKRVKRLRQNNKTLSIKKIKLRTQYQKLDVSIKKKLFLERKLSSRYNSLTRRFMGILHNDPSIFPPPILASHNPCPKTGVVPSSSKASSSPSFTYKNACLDKRKKGCTKVSSGKNNQKVRKLFIEQGNDKVVEVSIIRLPNKFAVS